MSARALALSASLLLAATPLSGQSIFNSAGIGLPMEALDGRARALGSFGLGLPGPALLPADPAAAARVVLPTGMIVAQPSWVDMTRDGTSEHTYFQGTRFPLMAFAYPAFGGALTAHIASVFDQSYGGERTVDVVLGGTTYPTTDTFIQDGSVSMFGAGYGRAFLGRFAAGISVGRYSGRVTRRLARDYTDPSGIDSVEPYLSEGSWRYSGESVTGGVSADVFGAVRIAGSATWSTDLRANATGGTAGADAAFSIPLQFRLGASAVLNPGLTVSASAVRADWSVAGNEIDPTARAGTVMGYGGGLELSQVGLFGREAPLRLGYRRSELPFSLGGEGATEQVFSGGLALVLGQAEGIVLSTVEIGIEKGRREGGGVTEDFWRGTISVRLSVF